MTTLAPAKDPLTTTDRQIIATIIERSDYPHVTTADDVITIWIDCGIVVVKMTSGYARFNQDQFRTLVAEVKAELPETPAERNQRLYAELAQAAQEYGITYGQIDWVSFSTKIYSGMHCLGIIGCNSLGLWYARPRERAANHFASSAAVAIASLGVKAKVAA